MSVPKDSLIYPAADALNISLHEVPDKGIRGAISRVLRMGPIPITADVVVASCGFTDTQAVYAVRLYGGLWLLLLVTALNNGLSEVEMIAFDGNTLGIQPKDMGKLPKEIPAIIKKVCSVNHTFLAFDQKTNAWKRNDSFNLDKYAKA